jgi:hypothetical protein
VSGGLRSRPAPQRLAQLANPQDRAGDGGIDRVRRSVKARPDESRLRLSYGEALLGASQFAAACSLFDQLKDRGLGPRDLGLPAARACLLKGDADAAVGWLRSIPSRFLPRDVEADPAFAPIRERADFKALFAAGQ